MKRMCAALLALISLSTSAAFAATGWGVHAPTESVTYSVPSHSFRYDTISFSLASPSNLTLTGTPSFAGIVGQTALQFGGALLTPAGASSPFSVYQSPSGTFSFAGLAAGDYLIDLGVMSLANTDGSFTLTSTISAVPEPATYALLLAGLAVVGVMAQRRNRRA